MKKILFVALAYFSFLSTANATLIGDTVSCQLAGILDCGSDLGVSGEVVSSAIEFSRQLGAGNTHIFIDLDASSIEFTTTADSLGTTGLLRLFDLDWIGTPGRITGIENFFSDVGAFNNMGDGVTESDVTFGDDWVSIDLSMSQWGTDGRVSFDLVTEHFMGTVAEPSILALFLVGFAFMLTTKRTRGYGIQSVL